MQEMPRLPRSMPNANQCRSKSSHWTEMPLNAKWVHKVNWMPIIAAQCQSMPINWEVVGQMVQPWKCLQTYGLRRLVTHTDVCSLCATRNRMRAPLAPPIFHTYIVSLVHRGAYCAWVVHIAPSWCTSTPFTVVVVYNVPWVHPDRQTDGRTLPILLSPCFAKATRSIITLDPFC